MFGWLHFPSWITIGGGPEGALQWHFLAMWILVLNGFAYLAYGLKTGRFRRMLLPIRPHEVLLEIRKALRLELEHEDLTRYNAVQRLLYIGIIAVIIVQVLSGLVIWKPVQFSELSFLFYDFQGARLVHFLGMVAIVGFVVVHVALALIVPKTLVAMLTGGPQVPEDPTEAARERMRRHLEIRIGTVGPCHFAHPRLPSSAPRRGIDQSVLEENKQLVETINRRKVLRGALSLGALTMLTGCDVTRRDSVQSVLRTVSQWNDRAQARCSGRTTWRRRIAPRRSSSRRASTPTTMSRTSRRSTWRTGSWSWAA